MGIAINYIFTKLKPILEIQGISKKFQIQSNQQPYLSLRENLFSFLKPSSKKEEFWALKDVTFNVMPGDTIGIIGKNGAGKSTLLKVLSKITPPTSGKIISRGRIASLLEVGTGFHPELSGRENIFMNGSILGMRKTEILKNFDAIVDFAGVEKFIDTPLKHYSSGMQLRLAFAVAAFLENEILIIDEVLAVGDAEFQKKCMGKMGEVSRSGRTVLFVSHNTTAIQSLCLKSVYLEMGKLKISGRTTEVLKKYHYESLDLLSNDLRNFPRTGYKSEKFHFTYIKSLNPNDICENNEVSFRLGFRTKAPLNNLALGFSITDHLNINLIECKSHGCLKQLNLKEEGEYYVDFGFKIGLKAGIYSMNIGSKSSEGLLEALQSVLLVNVKSNYDNSSELDSPSNGYLFVESEWTFSDKI